MWVVACPMMNWYAPRIPPGACPYDAVGMQRASHSAIGLPSRSSIASLMLGFLMPADVKRSFTLPPGVSTADENVLRPTDPYAVQTGRPLEIRRLADLATGRGPAPSGGTGTPMLEIAGPRGMLGVATLSGLRSPGSPAGRSSSGDG
jgi:hypothetical protein